MSLVEGPLQSLPAPPGLPAPVVHSRVGSSMEELHERPLSIDASPEPSTSGSVESNNAFFQHKVSRQQQNCCCWCIWTQSPTVMVCRSC
jgi:hypothetical protein